MGEGLAIPTDSQHTSTITQPSTSQPQKTQKPRNPKRKNIEVPRPSGSNEHVADEAVNEEMDDSLVRDATTASSLEAEQDNGVLDDEEVFVGQDMDKKEINVTEKEVSTADLVTTTGEVVTTASVEISTAKPTKTIITDDLTLGQTLIEIRSAKPKVKGVVIGEQSESTTRTRPQQLSLKDKGKAIMEELEKPTKRKDQIMHDEEKLFDKAMKRVNTFVDMDTELVEESTKKKKVDEDREIAKLQRLMKVIPDEEKVITRADGSSKMYLVFSYLLKIFDREDLETLWRLVKAKIGYTRPEEGYERVLWGDLKVMFEPHVEDAVGRNLQGNKVLIWKLFDSRRVHFVRFQSLHIYMLVKKKYPLTPTTITDMLNRKLQADHWNEMCYQLLNSSQNSLRINEVFGSTLVIMKLLIKKL
ncbi:hypothetical protein Tco_1058302 [Tanacetum coccineum]|uniref:Uncharacterized protein n=1 Tax=Tanacetum coccineum TaxID=301880 RepID=A0ABQ5H7T9_9ASTR